MSRFVIGKKYKSTNGAQTVTCIGVSSTGAPFFEWPSGSTGGVSPRSVSNWHEVIEEIPMEPKTEFKAGDVVEFLTNSGSRGQRVVKSVEPSCVWFTTGTWDFPTNLKLVKRANDTFVVGQKYIDKAKNIMIVLAQSPADPKRFYTESLSSPHVSGSEFIHNAYLWEPYKEPIKEVRYFNLYRDGVVVGNYRDRAHADKIAKLPDRISCKRVEFVEGEYDD